MEKSFKKKIYTTMLNGEPVYIKTSCFGLGISRDGSCFQVTNHTLFTFLEEYNLKPINFKLYKK